MDITKKNFADKWSELSEAITEANFLAIDCEFTGIPHLAGVTNYDLPSDYYEKQAEHSTGFIIIQFGLTAFRVSEKNNENFEYKSFNFYVFPRASRQFACQGQSMTFLSQHNFDFNKLFSDGLACCDLIEANEMRKKFVERKKQLVEWHEQTEPDEKQLITIPIDQTEFLSKICAKVEAFLISNEKEEILPNMNSFQRKLVYQTLEDKFDKRIFTSSRQLDNFTQKQLVVERCKTAEEEEIILNERIAKESQELEDSIGFTKVIELISNSKKLIVGHNMFLDVLYMVRQFIGPLPKSVKDFKHTTHKMFPYVMDTKYLCGHEIFDIKINSNILAGLHECLSQEPFEQTIIDAATDEYSYGLNNSREHEAGYDSYLTGVCFIKMAMNLGIEPKELNEKSIKLRNYINKLFIMRITDINYINLTGAEPIPSRNHVFYVTMPEHWKQSNLIDHFHKFGNINISWIDSTSAFVALYNRENSSIVIKSIKRADGFTIKKFADYRLSKKSSPPTTIPIQLTAEKRKISGDSDPKDSNSSNNKLPSKKKEKIEHKKKKNQTAIQFTNNDDWS